MTSRLRRAVLVGAILLFQAVCALFFISDILLSVFGLYPAPISWQNREILELGAAIGLVLGLALGAFALAGALREGARAKARLRRATSAFEDLLEERFSDWGLTAAEREVALFAIKGLSTAEIAALRETSEGTAKAQSAAIYRKAGVNGRGALLSLFVEDMMDQRAEAAQREDTATKQSVTAVAKG
ncbi:LuxR C-terminal-related transcriptional regulator [Thioclava sp. F36-6]|uniref:helix-turn-helix transcriptional regulator n=1 Tax=Thioclava sp. F36-6 TaxID=1915316 RepID=UPI000996C095|nr:LuxR C-terminal-related transcriptional regulator [Thioclava sp. F36-6]OOY30545.1 helix-turn-helix transcriptional regulator [Thioclava sp. F36-6]